MRLVDADALLKAMKERKWYIGRASDPVCLVEDAPTIDAVPAAHASWLPGGRWGDGYCSACGHSGIPADIWYFTEEEFGFCPNCGAKIDGKKEEE